MHGGDAGAPPADSADPQARIVEGSSADSIADLGTAARAVATHHEVTAEQLCDGEHQDKNKSKGAAHGLQHGMSMKGEGEARVARGRRRGQQTGDPAPHDGTGTPTPVTERGDSGPDGAGHEPPRGGAASAGEPGATATGELEGGRKTGAGGTSGALSAARLHTRGLGATGRSGTGGWRESMNPAGQQPEWRRARSSHRRKKRSGRSEHQPTMARTHTGIGQGTGTWHRQAGSTRTQRHVHTPAHQHPPPTHTSKPPSPSQARPTPAQHSQS
jgi:hypothetical protein